MIYNAIDGTVVGVTQEFLDDEDIPLQAAAGYPQVRLFDVSKSLLSRTLAVPSTTPGSWTANVSIPALGVTSRTELRLVWLFRTTDGEKLKVTDAIITEPKTEYRASDVIAMFGDTTYSLVLPTHFSALDEGTYQVYLNNEPVMTTPGDLQGANQITRTMDKTTFLLPMVFPAASLQSALLKVDVTPLGGTLRSFMYKMWAVTPQILLAANFLEDFLNKSRIENTIPELQYTQGDLISYLERGLYLFNNAGHSSSWNGLNMQGVLLDAWLTCSCYYALGAQLLAEGSLAFDFSGQGISLNVDRTPQLDAALGRIESSISDKVIPLKKQLAIQGLRSGDGSIGSRNLNVPSAKGMLGIINAPTTSLPYGMPVFTGRRF